MPTRHEPWLNCVSDGKVDVQTATWLEQTSRPVIDPVEVVPRGVPSVVTPRLVGNTQVLYGGHANGCVRKFVSVIKLDHDDGTQAISQVPVNGTGQANTSRTVAAMVEAGLQSHPAGQQLASVHCVSGAAVVSVVGAGADGVRLATAVFELLIDGTGRNGTKVVQMFPICIAGQLHTVVTGTRLQGLPEEQL